MKASICLGQLRGKISLHELNTLNKGDFTKHLGNIFESSPWVAQGAWERRPFRDVATLHAAMCDVVSSAQEEVKEGLINAHPDLVGPAALAGSLTPESRREQASAGLDNLLSAEEIALFTKLNKAYRQQFGFPFVICARENKKEAILSGFEARLHNSRQAEVETALQEIAKIARLRLQDLIEE